LRYRDPLQKQGSAILLPYPCIKRVLDTAPTVRTGGVPASAKHGAIVDYYVDLMGSWGEQYSTGDQGIGREEFWRSSYTICPSCKGKDFKNTVDCAGCRHNGDGYGTEVYECLTCHWKTSFQYDETGMDAVGVHYFGF
jgi:hypothetical protein